MSHLEAEMTTPPDPATQAGALVSPGWLDAHLHDPAVRVVEVDVAGVPMTSGISPAPSCGTSTPT